jgi:hypothetical protein
MIIKTTIPSQDTAPALEGHCTAAPLADKESSDQQPDGKDSYDTDNRKRQDHLLDAGLHVD